MDIKSGMIGGGKARIKATGQIVNVKRWSAHGIAVIEFKTGGEYIMPVHKLIPIASAV